MRHRQIVSCACLHDQKQFPAGLKILSCDQNLRAAVHCRERTFAIRTSTWCKPLAVPIWRPRRPARNAGWDQAASDSPARYDSAGHGWLKGIEPLSPLGAVAPGCQTCLGQIYLCNRRPAGMICALLDARRAISVVPTARSHSRRTSPIVGGDLIGGLVLTGALNGTLIRLRDTELEGCDFRGADLRESRSGQLQHQEERCSQKRWDRGRPFLLHAQQGNWIDWNPLARCSRPDSLLTLRDAPNPPINS